MRWLPGPPGLSAWAVEHGVKHGLWGGMTARERRAIHPRARAGRQLAELRAVG